MLTLGGACLKLYTQVGNGLAYNFVGLVESLSLRLGHPLLALEFMDLLCDARQAFLNFDGALTRGL